MMNISKVVKGHESLVVALCDRLSPSRLTLQYAALSSGWQACLDTSASLREVLCPLWHGARDLPCVRFVRQRPRPDPETCCRTTWTVHLCRMRECGDCSGSGCEGARSHGESVSPRPPSMPLRGWRCVTAPSLIGEDVRCAAVKRTLSHRLRRQPRGALCPARTTSSDDLRRQGRYRWEWQFRGALSSAASTNSTPGLKNSGLAGGDGEESNSAPPVR